MKKIGNILKLVAEDPEIKQLVKELAIQLNDMALKPFLQVALVTVDEMGPQIDIASDKLRDKVFNAVRKVTDSAGNAVLSGLGTVPYIGNILNATELIANVALGVQGIVDEASEAVLDQTLQLLIILQKIGGPANVALDTWVTFAINARNMVAKFKNAYDKVTAASQGKDFIQTPLVTKKSLIDEIEAKKNAMSSVPDYVQNMPEAPTTAPEEVPDYVKNMPEAPTTTPGVKKTTKPIAVPSSGGGRRRKTGRKKKTKKRNQKKRTKRKSRRRK